MASVRGTLLRLRGAVRRGKGLGFASRSGQITKSPRATIPAQANRRWSRSCGAAGDGRGTRPQGPGYFHRLPLWEGSRRGIVGRGCGRYAFALGGDSRTGSDRANDAGAVGSCLRHRWSWRGRRWCGTQICDRGRGRPDSVPRARHRITRVGVRNGPKGAESEPRVLSPGAYDRRPCHAVSESLEQSGSFLIEATTPVDSRATSSELSPADTQPPFSSSPLFLLFPLGWVQAAPVPAVSPKG